MTRSTSRGLLYTAPPASEEERATEPPTEDVATTAESNETDATAAVADD